MSGALASKKVHVDPPTGREYRVIIEDPDRFPFRPGERDEYREATDAEYQEFVDFYNAQYDNDPPADADPAP